MSATVDVLTSNPSAGAAVRKVVQGGDPAANAEFSVTVPTGKIYALLAVRVVLVQGITQTPLPFLVLDDGTNIFAELPGSTAAQGASTTCTYTWAQDVLTTGQIGSTPSIRSLGAIPAGMILPAGYKVRSSTQGIGAATDYGIPNLHVVEYTL